MPDKFLIIGGGPVGWATAALLSKQGHSCTVFERADAIKPHTDESYPIGINTRGFQTLEEIDGDLAEECRQSSRQVMSWRIFAGNRCVANIPGTACWGTTRAASTHLLYKHVTKLPVEVKFGMKLIEIDLVEQFLVFERVDGSTERIDGRGFRIIACDGVWSIARQAMITSSAGFEATQYPWNLTFRMLFAKGDSTDLDPANHYVLGGIYAAVVEDGNRWAFACCYNGLLKENPFLLSEDPTTENVQMLRAFLEKTAPAASRMIDDEELHRYFSRRTFTGAVTHVNRLNHEEWLLLLGDAAHSVFPATGEGVNAGLEDALVLSRIAASGTEMLFEQFNTTRLAEVHALGELAINAVRSTADPKYRAADLFTSIVLSIGKKLRVVKHTNEEFMFGPEALKQVSSYTFIRDLWKNQRRYLFPIGMTIAKLFVKGGNTLPPQRLA
eukprot:TRINITY_DN40935_c0_g1_i1.p1 TRINITY_DN40935_c0_g1~~TRINITY_DN40935_c0_g1_i1.p1  ORF type:complete len:442 (-),score=64.42 TRINITY_DN40935_c0_g1_i1:63-1388(-)